MENITVVLLGLLVCVIEIVCHAPEITYVNKSIIRNIGEMAQFSCCIIGNYNNVPVCWFKLNTAKMIEPLMLSNSGNLNIPSARFTIQANDNCYNLTIRDIQEIDDGVYQCAIQIDLHTRSSADIMLKVKRIPVILYNSTKSVFVTEGEPVSLECYAEGYPNPKIFWKRTNAEILPAPYVGSIYRGNILQIKQVNRKDRGTYSCIADNGIGRGARHSVAVHVQCAPSITIPRPKLVEAFGKNINLECHVDAFPTPAIMWFKNGNQIYENHNSYSISERVMTDEITAGILSFVITADIHGDKYGDYICKAINGLGTAEAVIKVVPVSI
ncbi:Immunoglobulin subtype,Immunoglobulin-like domain,Immunoglobulin-like fold,Immunoglobulin subtype [Cinara cedri]|uniref:Immunoglobulin subtype,Immunoglobulin-like domain,Immunoglobulin-like fold,Immunoglobulin subtype n=1 Tax=Cinara cedri TaxID=506608 RepID=A0A5E4N2T9_9HEMI|nr:Immunoglobulin subtype,Immunoglobulin-like domain,Immunoglobulin-like fold,Immunoglobulin subtype [Cinara cedri]